MAEQISIRGPTIKLGQLLKLAGLVDSGAEVKRLLAFEAITVNEEQETRRGRQLRAGDRLRVGERELVLVEQPEGRPTR